MTFIDWIETAKPEGVLTAIVAAAIGCATWRIAWEQKEIAKEKVISELFDRRYQVYELFTRSVVDIAIHFNFSSSEDIRKILLEMAYLLRKAEFIFDKSVIDSFEELESGVTDFFEIVRKNEDKVGWHPRTSPELSIIGDSLGKLLNNLPKRIDSYMRIRDLRNRRVR